MSICISSFMVEVLMISCYIFRGDLRSCRVLFAFSRGIVEFLTYNKQASRKLLPVGCIVTDQERLLTLRGDEIGNIHCKTLMDKLRCPQQ